MPDPLAHNDLVSADNIHVASNLSFDMEEHLHEQPDMIRMTAAAVLFIATCRAANESPADVLEQIMDTAELGAAKQKGLN